MAQIASRSIIRKALAAALAHVYKCAYNTPVKFEWDERKARSNARKHRIEFADAVAVLEDDRALTIPDEFEGKKDS